MSVLAKTLVAGASLIVAFLLLLALYTAIGLTPDSRVAAGDELSDYAKQSLYDAGIVTNDDTIHYYYSEDIFRFDEYGNLFTDTHVISYEQDYYTDERITYKASYDEISDIEFEKTDSVLEDSYIKITVNAAYDFYLAVSSEEGGDQLFYDELVQTWHAKRHPENELEPEPAIKSNSEQPELQAELE